jgi:hypothetical protein
MLKTKRDEKDDTDIYFGTRPVCHGSARVRLRLDMGTVGDDDTYTGQVSRRTQPVDSHLVKGNSINLPQHSLGVNKSIQPNSLAQHPHHVAHKLTLSSFLPTTRSLNE